MWERDEDRLALLELAETGRLRRRSGQAEAWRVLTDLPWTKRTGRRGEVALVAEHTQALLELLDRVWADWRLARDALSSRSLDATPTGWRRLRDLLRAEDLQPLPERLNRHTAASAVAPHSKSSLGQARRAALGETTVTGDGIVRLRPPPGLSLRREGSSLEAGVITHLLGEVAVPERALLDGLVIHGSPRAVLLVENLGPHQDLEPPEEWLVVHVPGWNTATARLLLGQFSGVPLIHFGDLDPNGVRIVRHLRGLRPDLLWAVPDFWAEHIHERALRGAWPDDLDVKDAPALVRELVGRGLWMEQEAITLDPRLRPALELMLEG